MKKVFGVVSLVLAFTMLLLSQATAQHSATIQWTASTSAAANPTGVYNVYRAQGNCASASNTFAFIGSASSTLNTYTDTTVAASTTYCYEVTFAAGGQESADSNVAQAVIPQDPAPTPTPTPSPTPTPTPTPVKLAPPTGLFNSAVK